MYKADPDFTALGPNFHPTNLLCEQILNESHQAIYVCDKADYTLLFANKALLSFLDLDVQEIELGKKCYEALMHRDAPCTFCNMDQLSTKEFHVRNFYHPFSNKTFCLRGKLIEDNHTLLHAEYITDITEETNLIVQNRNLTTQLCSIINNVPTGVCLYKWDGAVITPLVISEAFAKLVGTTVQEYIRSFSISDFGYIHPEDRDDFMWNLQKTCKKLGVSEFIFRIINAVSQKYIWLNLKTNTLMEDKGIFLIYASFEDISEQVKLQQQLKNSRSKISKYAYEMEERFGVAAQQAGLIAWIYEFSTNRIVQMVNLPKHYKGHNTVENASYRVCSSSFLHPDDVGAMKNFYKRLLAGEQNISVVSRWKRLNAEGYALDSKEYGWYKTFYTTIFDGQGKPLRAIGTSIDISALRTAQQHLDHTLNSVGNLDEILISSFAFNVSTGLMIKHTDNISDGLSFPSGTPISDFLKEKSRKIVDETLRTKWEHLYSRETIIEAFNNGKKV